MQVFVWVGPDKGEYRAGDIVEILEDGVHPGKLVVADAWNSDCIMPGVAILDVPIVTEEQANANLQQLLAIPEQLRPVLKLKHFAGVETWSLPLAIRNRLASRKRSQVTITQIRDLVRRKGGLGDTELLARLRTLLGDGSP